MTDGKTGTIGDVLKGLGRITEDDIQTALDYQREHGGFFGEALVACGITSEDEIEFGLASQFDLPYLFPESDAVDLEAASLVSPEWALTHLTLPILKTADTLRVVVDSPLKQEPIEVLRRRTDLKVEIGLAAPATIRELVRQVYARAAAQEEDHQEPLSLENVLDTVHDAEASRWGISVRGAKATAWWDEPGRVRRRALAGGWREALEAALRPPPAEMVSETRTRWEGGLRRGEETQPVTIHCIAHESGREYLFNLRESEVPLEERFPPPAPGIVSEIRILARSGAARFVVHADPPELGHEILPHLPELTLDPSWRSIYVTARDQPAASGTFSVQLPADPATWEEEIEALKIFHFDVVTVDLAGGRREWAASALDVASVAFILWLDDDLEAAKEAGVRWRLGVTRDDEGSLTWSLESLHGR